MKKSALLLLITVASCLNAQKINTDLVYLVKEPAKKTAKTPVLIMLHGYSSNEEDLFQFSSLLDESFIVFSLRAPKPVAGGGFCWYSLEFLNDQKFRYDYRQVTESRNKVLSFISHACSGYHADSSQVFVLGFSQGTMMAYDMALAAPGKIKGVIALSGRLMEESKALKTDWSKAGKIKFFIAHGSQDRVIKISDGEAARDFLQSKKVTDLNYHTYDMPHSINARELADIKAWLLKK